MAANETRMLLLGAVAMFQPVNGYQIRRELSSWRVDEWANLKPGSIYHGLTRLAEQEFLLRHDVVDGTRPVAVYEITGAGREELDRLLVGALEEYVAQGNVGFSVAFGMLPLLSRDQVLASLTRRRVSIERAVAELAAGAEAKDQAPPHARRGLLLWMDLAVAELGWLREVIEDVKAGRLRFQMGEDWGWTPAAADPGLQMNLDREKYRALLGR
ncbi:PadR family transcriptional regulator [Nocardioides speluncae]|uniref:PadR family transcriptional regulator n=1 Tax=Nocardioides speluncae TaxID=2670337 RepID=UPI001F0B789B|nr:PadR family transcriptional regulator [Nocardioides speluncae]